MPIPEDGEQNYRNDAMHPQGEVRKGTPASERHEVFRGIGVNQQQEQQQ
jgi:hypothetical protein